MFDDALNWEFIGNPLSAYLHCILILLFGLLLRRLLAKFLSKQSFRVVKNFSQDRFSEEFVELHRRPVEQLLTLVILYFAFDQLQFPESWHLVPRNKIGLKWLIYTLWLIAIFIVSTKILLRVVDYFTLVLIHREESPFSPELANFLKDLVKVVLVIMVVFTGLRIIFHVNITALVASLGIGGLAVALAAQDTLANLLGSFIIYLDKPFKVGDQIEAGEVKGIVEHVGFRTTRVRTAEKSLLTVPNKKMVDSLLNNISQSESRRVKFDLMLSYKSKPEQILAIVEDIKTIIRKHPETTNDFIVRFSDFDANSLNILVIYFVQRNDYDLMIQVKEELNLAIMNVVTSHGCEFATPSSTFYISKTDF